MHGLRLNSQAGWFDYCRSGKRPPNIPAAPHLTYANDGWVGYSDWLGTGRIAPGQYRSFNEAREFARSLGLKRSTEWFNYCKSGKKPIDIPVSPSQVYAKAGWLGMGDWLGTGKIAKGQHRPFKKARTFARRLGLKSNKEWLAYCRSGKKPPDIPVNPSTMYVKAGWAGFGDWLGTGTLSTHLREFRSFDQARAFVHRLGLTTTAEWNAYCRSGKRPTDIPTHPDSTYANDGWAGYSDWLGTDRLGRGQPNRLPVHDDRPDPERQESLDYPRILARPVVASTGVEPDPIAIPSGD